MNKPIVRITNMTGLRSWFTSTVSALELGEDAGHVVADGFLAKSEPFSNRWVGTSRRDEVEDVVLPR
jgi:hypothetical protein